MVLVKLQRSKWLIAERALQLLLRPILNALCMEVICFIYLLGNPIFGACNIIQGAFFVLFPTWLHVDTNPLDFGQRG